MNNYKVYEQFFSKIVEDGNYRRRGKVFQTRNRFYYYDTGTGKVFECEKVVYEVLKKLQDTNEFGRLKELELSEEEIESALKQIMESVNNENILKAPLLETFSGEQVTDLKKSLENKLGQITFEVTQKCNLRCDYCIYQEENPKFRDFSQHGDMSFEIAKKVIDYSLDKMKDEFYITFYGGEPLLNFKLIKQCIEYVKSLNLSNTIMYSMTTNLTLMTKEIADYLAGVPNFTVVCSIDGNKELHDEHRKGSDGSGSFERAMEGLKNLRNAYGDRDENIIVNMVITPPYTRERFDKIQGFIEECPYINERNTIMFSYADNGKRHDIDELRRREKIENNIQFMERYNPIQCWSIEQFQDIEEPNRIFTWGSMLKGLLKIHKRGLSDTPMKKYYFNGCCIPGGRRLYITIDGEYHICERIGEAPNIGNVMDGINIPRIQEKYIDEYIEQSRKYCQNCWAAHLCGICYASCYDENGLDMDTKKIRCISEKFGIENQLIQYHEILERNPKLLIPLNEMELD